MIFYCLKKHLMVCWFGIWRSGNPSRLRFQLVKSLTSVVKGRHSSEHQNKIGSHETPKPSAPEYRNASLSYKNCNLFPTNHTNSKLCFQEDHLFCYHSQAKAWSTATYYAPLPPPLPFFFFYSLHTSVVVFLTKMSLTFWTSLLPSTVWLIHTGHSVQNQ